MGAEEQSTKSIDDAILLERMALYPGLYESIDDLKEDLLANGVEYLKKDVNPPKLNIYPRETEEPATATENENQGSSVMTRQQTQLDIWGRLPPKEPEAMIDCPVCKRLVSTLRFAPHLDKCMGIGTMSRASAPAR